jgi:hypothetical protein
MELRMKARWLAVLLLVSAAGAGCAGLFAQDAPAPQTQGWQGQRGSRAGGMMGMGRGTVGTVTEAAADHYTIKTEVGDIYTVHFSVNTRIVKQPAGQIRRGQGQGQGQGQGDGGERTPPQAIKATDIKVGDVIAASGEVDANAK